tara:strand:- start:52965 stop:55271 length:2307 start_codon:yes stop_codon:yes gene_type:complete
MEQITLISDLAKVTICAGTVAILFYYIRLPLMLGYLISGLVVGPHLFSWGSVLNQEIIKDLSELGVIFLMFYIGLEFDLKKLQKMFGPSLLAVLLQCISMLFLGMMAFPLLGAGWTQMDGIFLGGLLAISSSMITIAILRNQQGLKSNYAQFTIGMLILEDIIAILMLVILTGMAVTGHFAWTALWKGTFFVGLFVVFVFIIGRLLAPYLVKVLTKIGNIEVLTVVVVGVVLGIGELAIHFEFSVALGAFLAGAILSQSSLSASIEKTTEPLRHLFSAIFFVTVGMLIEPQMLLSYWKPILCLTFLVVVIKTFTCWLGLFLAGTRSQTSFRAALCKSQIGEFSFIIAALGQSLGVTHAGLMPIAVGISLGTIVVVPLISMKTDAVYDYLMQRTPEPFFELGKFYHNILSAAQSHLSKSALLQLVRRPILQLFCYFSILIGIILIGARGADFLDDSIAESAYASFWYIGFWLVTALLCLPFLIAVIRNIDACLMLVADAALKGSSRQRLPGRMRNLFNFIVISVVLVVFSGFFLSTSAHYFPSGVALLIFVVLLIGIAFFFWRHIIRINSRLEHLFMESFNQRSLSHEEKRRKTLQQITQKYPWPVNVHEAIIERKSIACGKRIKDLNLREQTGASIIGLSRNYYTHYDPAPDTPLFPDDHLILLGDEIQNKKAEKLLRTQYKEEDAPSVHRAFKIEQICLGSQSALVGETLAGADFRRKFSLNVIGIQRGETRITAPKAEEILQSDDVLLVVGGPAAIKRFEQEVASN